MSDHAYIAAREMAINIDNAAQRRLRGEQTGFRLLANQHEAAVSLAVEAYAGCGASYTEVENGKHAARQLVFALARYDEAAYSASDIGFANPFTNRHAELARMYAEEVRRFRYSAKATEGGEPAMISIQEAWEAAGGNPGIKATRQDLLEALKAMDEAIGDDDARAPLSDDELRAEWLAAGGEIHGPNVETVSMPEAKYFELRRRAGHEAAQAAHGLPGRVLPCDSGDASAGEPEGVDASGPHYSALTLRALIDHHGWQPAPSRGAGAELSSVYREFLGVGTLGESLVPDGAPRRLSAGYDADASRRRYIALTLGDTLIVDLDGRDASAQHIARLLNLRAEQFADEKRAENGLPPKYAVGSPELALQSGRPDRTRDAASLAAQYDAGRAAGRAPVLADGNARPCQLVEMEALETSDEWESPRP